MLTRLSTVLRGLLVCVFVVGGLVLAVQAPAAACTCGPGGAERQTSRADVVFLGTVDDVTRAGQQLEIAVTATHAYKGTVEPRTTVTTPRQTTACGIGAPKPGTDYLFLVRGDAPPYAATSCGGTDRVDVERVAQVEGILGAGQAVEPPPPPPPPTAVRTRVETSPPASLARLAAPGAALVLLGVLGLVVVGRLGRRA